MRENDLKRKTKGREPEKTVPRRVFIDLDDAYGVPFSTVPVSPQGYGKERAHRFGKREDADATNADR